MAAASRRRGGAHFAEAAAAIGPLPALGLLTLRALAARGLLSASAPADAAELFAREAPPLAAASQSALFAPVTCAPEALRRADAALAPEIDAVRFDPGRLGELYASARTTDDRKRQGMFYTPRAVAEACLGALPPSVGPALHARDRIVDPACGGGRFLLAACDRLASHVPPAELAERLCGLDTDADAVAVARAALYLRLAERPGQVLPLDRTVRVGDLLEIHAAGTELGTFDAAVGNPPYRGGRFAPLAGLGIEATRRFRTAEYQVDPYVLFIEAALARLRRGGTLSLIVPNTFMSNLRTAALRGVLARDNTVEAILSLPADTFGAGVETVVLRAVRGGRTPLRVPFLRLDAASGAPVPDGTLVVPEGDRQAPWPAVRASTPRALEMRGGGTTLGDVADITRGVNPYHHTLHTPDEIAARIHHAREKLGPDYVPELRGRDLKPFRTAWSGHHWLRYGPWLKEPRDPRFFDGPRLLVRKILGETLVAAYLETPFCCDQSVYVAKLHKGQPWPPLALLACLSCRAVADLLRARHQEHDTLFPQLKVAELRLLPLPPVAPDAPEVRALGEQVAAFLAAGAPEAERGPIDAAAARLYGLD